MENNQKGFIGIVVVLVALLALGIGGYVVYKNKTSTPSSLPVATQVQDVGTVADTPSDTKPETLSPAPSPKPIVQSPIGDYQIRVLTPVENKTFYIGDTISVQVQVGKNITNVGPVIVGIDSDFEKNTSVTKLNNATYRVEYKLAPQEVALLGRTWFGLQGIFDWDKNPPPSAFKDSALSIPIILDSRSTPLSFEVNPTFTVKIGGQKSPDGTVIPSSPDIGVKFADGTEALMDDRLITYRIADQNIAIIEAVKFKLIQEIETINIKGLKVGTTTLTVTYKNLSTTITLIVTQ